MSETPAEPERPVRDSDEAPATEPAGHDEAGPSGPASLTFRILPISLLTVLIIAVCVTPLAFAHPALLSLYLLPLLLGAWVLGARTVVTPEKISARALLRDVDIDWDDIKGFKLNERRWLRAVLTSDKEVLLPAVRVRDLPRLAAMSGGRIPDPSAEARQDETETTSETTETEEAGETGQPAQSDGEDTPNQR